MNDAASDNLTGSWSGIFNYPDGSPSTAFDATLQDAGGIIVGETIEPGDDLPNVSTTFHAWLEGRHDGDNVHFVKCYDDASRADYTVAYSGSVKGDGTEIAGIWDIPGIWSGTFIMFRQVGHAASIESEIAETVR
ncbi:hypothetical protein ASG11_02045 [Sphingomonas sp. Leaf357]|uniref:hypothetical protein n=1 Tax=Sphingomonas sp. Leaf357 TaxID=1736350 RepID=UPI0006FBC9AC|nr:hypothetical protein [Sphingomonas sp. Leaf357]KQS03192.1 hypothetical protein ASG11_02045 [Sphingomonas sp. Leaf357]